MPSRSFRENFQDNRNAWPIGCDSNAKMFIRNSEYIIADSNSNMFRPTRIRMDFGGPVDDQPFEISAVIRLISSMEKWAGFSIDWAMEDTGVANYRGKGFHIDSSTNEIYVSQCNGIVTTIIFKEALDPYKFSLDNLNTYSIRSGDGKTCDFFINEILIRSVSLNFHLKGRLAGINVSRCSIAVREFSVSADGIFDKPKPPINQIALKNATFSESTFQFKGTRSVEPSEDVESTLHRLSTGRFTTDYDEWAEDQYHGGRFSDPDYWITHTGDDD